MKYWILCTVLAVAIALGGCKGLYDSTPANFVSVGNEGQICWSVDGQAWVCEKISDKQLLDVAYGNGMFVAVSGFGGIYTSTDGKHWTGGVIDASKGFETIAYGNHVFITSAIDGTIARYDTEADAPAWQFEKVTTPGFIKIAFGNGRFVATGDTGLWYTDSPLKDGSWQVVESGSWGGSPFLSLVYDNGAFVVGGRYGCVFTAPDGFSDFWDIGGGCDHGMPLYSPFLAHGSFEGSDILVIAGIRGIGRSLDGGKTWVDVTPADFDETITCAAYGNGQFILGCSSGAIYRSADGGQTWQPWSSIPKKNTERKLGIAFRSDQ